MTNKSRRPKNLKATDPGARNMPWFNNKVKSSRAKSKAAKKARAKNR